MPTTINKAYNTGNLYCYPNTPTNPADVLVMGTPTTSQVEATAIGDDGVVNVVKILGSWGPFSSAPKTFADLINSTNFMSGNISQVISYANGVLQEVDEYTSLNAGTFLSAVLNQSKSALWQMYGGTNEFYSSTQVPINSWTDAIYSYPGSKNTYYELHPKLKNDDSFVGATGSFNQVVLPKAMSQFEIKTNNAIWNEFTKSSNLTGLTISSKDASVNSVNIVNVQRISFTDSNIALDISKDQTAGSGYMLYKAAFNREPDVGGLGFWISKMDGGMSYGTVAQNFVNSAEFKTAFGGSNPSVNTLVTKLYNNVLTRNPDGGGLAFWQEKLSTGGWTVANVLGYFATSPENVTNVTPLIAKGIAYTEWVG